MEEVFKFMLDSRKAFIDTLNELSIEELNEIPAGFSNNIIWNFGHIVVSTPLLCYVRTGVWKAGDSIEYVETFKKGTRPHEPISEEIIEKLKEKALSSIQQLEEDYTNGVFVNMQAFDTSTYHSSLQNMKDVLITCVGHDNLHYGYAKALIKKIKNK